VTRLPPRRKGGARTPFDDPAFARPQLTWRDLKPILLRCVGVIGLAGAIVTAISSNAFVGEPEPAESVVLAANSLQDRAEAEGDAELAEEPQTVASLAPPQDWAEPAPAEAAVSAPTAPAPEPETTTAPVAAPVAPAADPAPAEPVAPKQTPALAAIEPAPAPEPIPAVEPPPAPPPEAPPAEAAAAPLAPPASPAPSEEAGKRSSVWEKGAAACPRDWVAVSTNPDGSPAECAEAAPSVTTLAMVETDQAAIDEAAIARATELAGLQFAPRIPQARPEPPKAKPVRTATRKGARATRPADPPPNCGKKRARWRYVKSVPTWYCK